ncbi:kinase-like protein [Mytilinidion resinicola]|uniref:non-specific serine/threonine protein kinase n=1 Tax=Mytilinidion resinicola TaxID=574789 RepID=A0A6A6Z6I4_9PEZI|nr:kinase-like protein [Mytilinidion resinicola]KAF2816696.1 kinase-like protein [Mytilinidion resinicola]
MSGTQAESQELLLALDREDRARFEEHYGKIRTYAYWGTPRGQIDALQKWANLNDQEKTDLIANPNVEPPSPTASEQQHINDVMASGEWVYARVLDPSFGDHDRNKTWPPHRTIYLYVNVDTDYNIIDRVVVKRSEHSRGEGGAKSREYLLHEARLHEKLSDVGCKHIIGLRSWGDSDHENVFLLYMDYAPGGDIWQIEGIARRNKKQIPEIYLWVIFDALAEALYVLQIGNSSQFDANGEFIPQAPQPGWNRIVHRDIKPGDIFLGDPNPPYMGYLTPMLGDFGTALEMTDGLEFERRQGTPGWKAPEQMYSQADVARLSKPEQDALVFKDKTDIWAVGLVMWQLMRSSSYAYRHLKDIRVKIMDFEEPELESPYADGIVDDHLKNYGAMYSTNLERLVQKCVEAQQEDRPDINQLRRNVRRELVKAKGIFGDPEVAGPELLMEHLKVRLQDDAFGVGAQGPQGKRRRPPDGVDSAAVAGGAVVAPPEDPLGDPQDDPQEDPREDPQEDLQEDPSEAPLPGPPPGWAKAAEPTNVHELGVFSRNQKAIPAAERAGFLWWLGGFRGGQVEDTKSAAWYKGKNYKHLKTKWDALSDADKAMYRSWG